MGIRGIRKFLEQNSLLQPYLLKNTRVIVDGNNICHHLLWTGTSRHFGGDYSSIRQQAKLFFTFLQKNSVQPYVIFDGAHDEDNKKLENIISKCENRIQENEHKIPENLTCTPVLMYESFTMVLKELQIPPLACEGEADNQIAVLAKQWRCPVISDSDMYMFELPGGFVNFSDIPTDRTGEIQTKIYLTSKFEEKTGLSTQLLPLVAAIYGSTYAEIDHKLLDRFFQQLGAKKRLSARRDFQYEFNILKKVGNKNEGIQILMNCIDGQLKPEAANELKTKIKKSVDYFTIEKFEDYEIANYFDNPGCNGHHPYLPDRIMKNIRTCVLSSLPIDVTFGRIIIKPTLELYDLPPVQEICLPLRKVVYAVVIKSCPPDVQRGKVKEIIRDSRKMVSKPVMPSWIIDGYGSTPLLNEIDLMDLNDKLKLITAIFQIQPEALNNIQDDSALFHIKLGYFLRTIAVPDPILYSKSYIFLHVLLLNKENNPKLTKFYDRVCSQGGHLGINLHMFHQFLQRFQECLNMAYTINVLVGTPIKQPDPSVVYDGIFMYRFFMQNQTEADVDKIAKECFGENPIWTKLYNDMVNNIQLSYVIYDYRNLFFNILDEFVSKHM